MAIWINTGTISISAGGTTVTGSGTSFLTGGTQKGDMFQAPDGREYEITNIVSDTQLSIFKAYQGTNVTDSTNWDIIPTQGYVKALVDEVREYVETNNTIVDEIGTTGLSIAHGGTGAKTASGARANLGLGNVDNTSDADKPISTATEMALDGKLDLTATAADSAKLGGVAASGYVKKTDINGMMGNLSAPLTHLSLKKNLLTAQGQSIVTATRASARTYKNRYGVQVAVANDVMCFDENGLNCQGAGTNACLYSEQFDNAAWFKARLSISANTALVADPFGTNFADKIIANTATDSHYIAQTGSYIAGQKYAQSYFLKAGEYKKVRLTFHSSAFSETSSADFDLESGTASLSESSLDGYNIKKSADGWYRCTIIKTATVSTSITNGAGMLFMLSPTGEKTFAGDGTSGLYVFGAQIEALPFATSYIPTTTAAATRAGNNISIPFADNMPDYQHDFAVAVDYRTLGVNPSATQYLYSDGSASGFRCGIDSVGKLLIVINGTLHTSANAIPLYGRLVLVKSATLIKGYVDGVLILSVSISTMPSSTSGIYIGSYNGTSNYLYGTISDLRIYDRELTAEEVYAA